MPELQSLACEFFQEFARHEYCLKVVGLRKNGKEAKADWLVYANEKEIFSLFERPPSSEFKTAIDYYSAQPPKKQVIANGNLEWDPALPAHKTNAELVLRLVCRVRNNLFHGGKFNGHWFEPQRSLELLSHGLVILATCVQAHSAVKAAYTGCAV